jgi:GTP-binding protein
VGITVIDAKFLAGAPTASALPEPSHPEVAFVGRSNVGKSSLIATLLGRKKLVRVSRRPGCTQAINLFGVVTSEGPLVLADLPGYGYAEAPLRERRKWGPLIASYLGDRPTLFLVVVLFDPRRELVDEDLGLLQMLEEVQRPAIVVGTKIDKIVKARRKLALNALSEAAGLRAFPFSAKTGEGADLLWQVIARSCGIVGPDATT